jgi:hypothetical protein
MSIEETINDQLDSLLNYSGQYHRTGKQIITLAGALLDGPMPEPIARQMSSLTRQVMLWDLLDLLRSSLDTSHRFPMTNIHLRETTDRQGEEVSLLAQIEATRKEIVACEPVNHAELIAWVIGLARGKKLIGSGRGRR